MEGWHKTGQNSPQTLNIQNIPVFIKHLLLVSTEFELFH